MKKGPVIGLFSLSEEEYMKKLILILMILMIYPNVVMAEKVSADSGNEKVL